MRPRVSPKLAIDLINRKAEDRFKHMTAIGINKPRRETDKLLSAMYTREWIS